MTRNWYAALWIFDFLLNSIAYVITWRYAAHLAKQKYLAIAKADAAIGFVEDDAKDRRRISDRLPNHTYATFA